MVKLMKHELSNLSNPLNSLKTSIRSLLSLEFLVFLHFLHFLTPFLQLQILIASICGTDRDIDRRQVVNCETSRVPPRRFGELWSTNHKV